jgi:enoyl-CoA hydratase/carnithine racemase
MPPKKAKEILFEHRVLRAEEALSIGFVNRVYSRDRLETETMAYAERVADNDPAMVMSAKYAINETLDHMGYAASVASAFHAGSAFGFARMANEPHKAYQSFSSAQENPHANRVRTAFERFRADQQDRP